MTAAVRAYVGLGANLGDPRAAIEAAFGALAAIPATRLAARSVLYLSAPVDAAGPEYINAVAALDTGLAADVLLRHLHAIEASAGRERPYPHAPRTLDLDLLLWGSLRCATQTLTLPHPRLHLRAFVLEPLADVAPGLVVDGLGDLQLWRRAASGQRVSRLPG